MKNLTLLLALLGLLPGCAKPPEVVIARCDLTIADVCFVRQDGHGHRIPYTDAEIGRVAEAIDKHLADPLAHAPVCPSEKRGGVEGASCTNAEFVAFEDGKITAYYQSGTWKKPNGEPLEMK